MHFHRIALSLETFPVPEPRIRAEPAIQQPRAPSLPALPPAGFGTSPESGRDLDKIVLPLFLCIIALGVLCPQLLLHCAVVMVPRSSFRSHLDPS